MQIATYKISNSVESFDVPDWLAFIVLPNGKLWDVRFSGATEEEAKLKAIELWESERVKAGLIPNDPAYSSFVDPWSEVSSSSKPEKLTSGLGRGSHLRGKTWMRHKETRDLIAVPLTEITLYESRGYERGGPRSK